jgi:hypothetical protein
LEERAKHVPVDLAVIPQTPPAAQPSSLENLARYAGLHAILRLARDKAEVDTLNDLVADRLVGFGCPSDSYKPKRIEASFWIGAAIEGDTASRNAQTFSGVRIVAPDAIPSAQPKPRANSTAPQRTASKVEAQSRSQKERGKNVGGRRKTRTAVKRAFRSLWNTSPEFRSLGVKGMVPEVRAALLDDKDRKHEETSGYRSSSMAKIISHELSVLRNRKIPNKRNKAKPR